MEGLPQEMSCCWKQCMVDWASSRGKPGLELRQDGKRKASLPFCVASLSRGYGRRLFFFSLQSFYEKRLTCFRLLKQPPISNRNVSVGQVLEPFFLPSRNTSVFSKNNLSHHKSLLAAKSWAWTWKQAVSEPSLSKTDPNRHLMSPLPRAGDAGIGAAWRGTSALAQSHSHDKTSQTLVPTTSLSSPARVLTAARCHNRAPWAHWVVFCCCPDWYCIYF